ncbi:nuclear transport factor 2 family protein [Pseudochelatococcus sp. B33]
MDLPAPIRTYFEADARNDAEAFATVFAVDAVVDDEGETHRGPEAIRRWWQAAKAKYRHTAEPFDLLEAEGKSVVYARVRGDFPGSPVTLTFTFGLDGGRIMDLEIR